MAFRYTIRLSGAGGHGLIQAARILAEAAAIYDNKNAAESCSYGPEARGSSSRAEVIISDEDIDSPRVDKVDLLVALTQEAHDKYAADLTQAGILVTDRHVVTAGETPSHTAYSVPFMEIAENECRRPAMVNIVALGFCAAINDAIDRKSVLQAIKARIPKMSEDAYLEAYEAGLKAAHELTT